MKLTGETVYHGNEFAGRWPHCPTCHGVLRPDDPHEHAGVRVLPREVRP